MKITNQISKIYRKIIMFLALFKKKRKREPTYSYKKDKRKYIKFHGNKRKMKLRQHIREVSEQVTVISEGTYSENRSKIIKLYNKHGLYGMHEQLLKKIK